MWSEKNTLGNSDYRTDSVRGVMDADDQCDVMCDQDVQFFSGVCAINKFIPW